MAADGRVARHGASRPVQPKRVQRDFEDLVAFVVDRGLAAGAVARHRLAELAVEVAEVRALSLVLLDAVQHGEPGVVEAACNKLAGSEACQHIARAAVELGGPEALVRGTMSEFLWRQSISETIGGGTSEVIRGVIARMGLGLVPSR